jgi:hypothetical protein
MIIVKTKPTLLTDEQWQLVIQYHISDRGRNHAESICKRCGTLIDKSELRIAFAQRSPNGRPGIHGYCHRRHLEDL